MASCFAWRGRLAYASRMAERDDPERPPRRIFTYAQARALLPEVRRQTQQAREQAEALRVALETRPGDALLQASLEEILRGWAQAMLEHGLDVKGLWLVDFDNGMGCYCWRWPEKTLEFFHTHEEGFAGRQRIQ